MLPVSQLAHQRFESSGKMQQRSMSNQGHWSRPISVDELQWSEQTHQADVRQYSEYDQAQQTNVSQYSEYDQSQHACVCQYSEYDQSQQATMRQYSEYDQPQQASVCQYSGYDQSQEASVRQYSEHEQAFEESISTCPRTVLLSQPHLPRDQICVQDEPLDPGSADSVMPAAPHPYADSSEWTSLLSPQESPPPCSCTFPQDGHEEHAPSTCSSGDAPNGSPTHYTTPHCYQCTCDLVEEEVAGGHMSIDGLASWHAAYTTLTVKTRYLE